MIWIDWCILGVLGVSTLISVFRGLVREVLSLVAWLLAGWLSLRFSTKAGVLLENFIPVPSARIIVAGAIIFILVLFGVGLLNYLIGLLIRKTGLSATDRSLGMLFGLARGVAIVALLVLVAGATPIPNDPWWRESLLLKHFQRLAENLLVYLPATLSGYIQFPAAATEPRPVAPSEGHTPLPAIEEGR
jgi:membrane protein required for colicin V production